jgi:transposase-like protein
LNKWLLGFYLLCSSKKGMSAHQLHRMLGITYKSAWFMAHRIRYAMTQGPFQQRLSGTVEVDETYVGGKLRNDNRKKREAFSSREPSHMSRQVGRAMEKKVPVVALIQRGGDVRAFKVPNVTADTLGQAIRTHVARDSHLRTDAFKSYTKVGREYASHEFVNHMDEYVRGDVHTNTAENFFSILKRGINGVYHHVSEEHLGRYLDEFSFRYNHLSSNGWTDAQRTEAALAQTGGKRLRYADTR